MKKDKKINVRKHGKGKITIETEVPLWVRAAKKLGFPLLPFPSLGLQFLSKDGRLPAFLIYIPPAVGCRSSLLGKIS